MKVNVHVKEKTLVVQCGDGNQRILWLAHVGIARYDSNFGLELGIPKGVQRDNGKLLDLNATIKENLADNEHVWILLKDDSPVPKILDSMITNGSNSSANPSNINTSSSNIATKSMNNNTTNTNTSDQIDNGNEKK